MKARDTYPKYLETPSIVFAGNDLTCSNLLHNLNTTSLSVFNTFIFLLVHTFQEQPDHHNTCRTLHFTYISQELHSTDCDYLNQRVYTPQGLTNAVDFSLLELCCAVVGIIFKESELVRWHYLQLLYHKTSIAEGNIHSVISVLDLDNITCVNNCIQTLPIEEINHRQIIDC